MESLSIELDTAWAVLHSIRFPPLDTSSPSSVIEPNRITERKGSNGSSLLKL